MFSDQIYLDVVGLIDSALDQMPTPEVIDKITIVQGYLQLSLGEHGLYDGKVQEGLDAVLKLARHLAPGVSPNGVHMEYTNSRIAF